MNTKMLFALLVLSMLGCLSPVSGQSGDPSPYLAPNYVSGDKVIINLVALDQPWFYNRLGATQPTGMIYALEHDVVAKDPRQPIGPGNAKLRNDKRPRPVVLRCNQGDMIEIRFKNYLRPYANPGQKGGDVKFFPPDSASQLDVNSLYPKTRWAGVHITGMELADSVSPRNDATIGTNPMINDGSFTGANPNGMVEPGDAITYLLFAAAPGSFLIQSPAAMVANQPLAGGTKTNGLFGMMNVQPPLSEWYRSQVREDELYRATQRSIKLAATGSSSTNISKPAVPTPENRLAFYDKEGYPVIDYNATWPGVRNGIPNKPILKMFKQTDAHTRELIYSDLTAIITGPSNTDNGNTAYHWPPEFITQVPDFYEVYANPNQLQPYREFGIMYHEVPYAVEAFPVFYDANGSDSDITFTARGGLDQFAINYGTGGIAPEIYANRIGVGPMHECTECVYEEFFLSSWTVGDPAMVVNIPGNVAAELEKANIRSLKDGNKLLNDQMLKQAVVIGEGRSGLGNNPVNNIDTLVQAGYAYYPDDPSNVYHSYINDHVKFRIGHTGGGLTHVHHQHAAQWLHSPKSQNGHYLDSQTINPGATYTLNMVYDGSGNVNKVVGDNIFHCHFYPHFAQGMWGHWRTHDVLEQGSILDIKALSPTGSNTPGLRPLASSPPNAPLLQGTRGLPDGEIGRGTPIPAIVPIPAIAMAPVPGKIVIEDGQVLVKSRDKNPGYPFFIAGIAGSRVPKPPLDFAKGEYTTVAKPDSSQYGSLNGGLPRKVIIDGDIVFQQQTKYDWTKLTDNLTAVALPEDGTFFEKLAMQAHSQRVHETPNSVTMLRDTFILNGLPPIAGAPYANPAIHLDGTSAILPDSSNIRIYKGANIQIDAVLNKLGWHYPQTRPIVLWGDVASTVSGDRPPQPLFFRANSEEVIQYWHTNLVPEYYELDDYQVRTPTDVIGQHIHLVKFDVTSSDGAANGWNYEDGTYSPEFVNQTIDHINNGGKWLEPDLDSYFGQSIKDVGKRAPASTDKLSAHLPNPIWGNPPSGQDWTGAQTTIQLWYADPLYNNAQTVDRTLRTVFTHDHFSPSTHQQVGLYAGLLIEPKNSTWLNSNTGEQLGKARASIDRSQDQYRYVYTEYQTDAEGVPSPVPSSLDSVSDGGPTNWQAAIITENNEDSYREFMYEFQDNQQAYTNDSRATIDPYPEWHEGMTNAQKVAFADSAKAYRGWMDTEHVINPPGVGTPEIVTTGNKGILTVNYRNEPLPGRVLSDSANTSSDPNASDMAYAFSSNVVRSFPQFNEQPDPGYVSDSNQFIFAKQPISPAMQGGDPFTPLARAYIGDKVQIRTLVGSHVNPHYFNVHGAKWLFEPSLQNSGFRNTQAMGISEHFEMNFNLGNIPPTNTNKTADYLIKTNADETGMQSGTWGIMRAYGETQTGADSLITLPNNVDFASQGNNPNCGCPSGLSQDLYQDYDVTAVSIDQYLSLTGFLGTEGGKLAYNQRFRNYDPSAVIFIQTKDMNDFLGGKGDDYMPQPLVLRAAAGECVRVTLRNQITPGFVTLNSNVLFQSNANFPYEASTTVGLHPDLLSYDVGQYDGSNVGFNEGNQTVEEGDAPITYEWYAGQWIQNGNSYQAQPVEFGTTHLGAPDPLLQYLSGLFGALIVEPENSTWTVDENKYSDYTSANVFDGNGNLLFREFVLNFQNNLMINAEPIGLTYGAQVNDAINYKSEPLGSRFFTDVTDLNSSPGASNKFINYNQRDIYQSVANQLVLDDPETPVLAAAAGQPVRLRILHTGGTGDGNVFDLHGHNWQEEPYVDSSTRLGYNNEAEWMGTRGQLGALNSFDILVASAGGQQEVAGDYLYLDWRAEPFSDGVWGIMRVTDGGDATHAFRVTVNPQDSLTYISVAGSSTPDPVTGLYPTSITLSDGFAGIIAPVSSADGSWTITGLNLPLSDPLTVVSIPAKDGRPESRITYTPEQLQEMTKGGDRIPMVPVVLPIGHEISPGLGSPISPTGPRKLVRKAPPRTPIGTPSGR